MLAEYTSEELAAGLDRVVERILADAGIAEPPVDALAVAKSLQITVAWDDRQESRARYVRLSPRRATSARPIILLKPEPRTERRQWAVAHEIGEHLACQIFAEWGISPQEAGPNSRENAANDLAGRLLLPSMWFETDGATSQWDLPTLKARYLTASHELIARRMLECRTPVLISIFDHEKITFRRANWSGGTPPLSPLEIDCWRRVHRHNQAFRMQRDAATIQGWPIHEVGWKREILRLEIDVYGMERQTEYERTDED